MRIGLDLTCLKGERFGMSWVAWWQAAWLPRVAPDDQFVYFLPPGEPSPAHETNVRVVRVPYGNWRGARLLTEQWHLPRLAAREGLDVLHTIAFAAPLLYRGPQLLTIHDLGYHVFPETVPALYRRYWNWAYGPAARRCAHLVAVSESTRLDVVNRLGRPASDVSVVRYGTDPTFLADGSDGGDAMDPRPVARSVSTADLDRLEELRRGGPYILHVGVWQPRKDLVTLLKTFEALSEEFPELRLALCGVPGWGYPAMETLVARHAPRSQARVLPLTGWARPLMPALYQGAELLLFTSLHEGFGLPLLEAMASGTPIVTTDSSSIPEVVGDAALRAPVGDVSALTAQARRILSDRNLGKQLAQAGKKRAAMFTWRKSAQELLNVYRTHFTPKAPHR